MKQRKATIKDWYKKPLSKKHLAELRYKLALTRNFISQLHFAMQGLPPHISLFTKDGEVNLNSKYLEKLLKKTSNS